MKSNKIMATATKKMAKEVKVWCTRSFHSTFAFVILERNPKHRAQI